jgi:hypothetical protein
MTRTNRWRDLAIGLLVLSGPALGCAPDDDAAGRDDGGVPDRGIDDGGGDTDVPGDDGGGGEIPVDGGTDAACYQDLDIVFVLDVSTSMTPVLGALYGGIADVWAQAEAVSPDPRFGLVVFVDDVRVTRDGAAYDSLASLQAEFASWRDFCSSNDQPGGSPFSNTDCPENTIDGIWSAVDAFAWRPESLRIVILATDDTFKEYPERLAATFGTGGVQVGHTYADLVSHLRANQIRVAAFAAHDSRNCSIPPVHDCTPGFFAPWLGEPPLGEATGAAVFDIQEVRTGAISLSEAINGVILDEYCTPYLI